MSYASHRYSHQGGKSHLIEHRSLNAIYCNFCELCISSVIVASAVNDSFARLQEPFYSILELVAICINIALQLFSHSIPLKTALSLPMKLIYPRPLLCQIQHQCVNLPSTESDSNLSFTPTLYCLMWHRTPGLSHSSLNLALYPLTNTDSLPPQPYLFMHSPPVNVPKAQNQSWKFKKPRYV